MKIFVALTVVLYSVISANALSNEEKKAIELQLLNECKTKEGGTDADIETMLSREHPSTTTGKCMSACIGEIVGVIKDNKVSIEGAVEVAKMLHPENERAIVMAKKLANACETITDPDRCEFAAKMMKCTEEAAIANGLDPRKMF